MHLRFSIFRHHEQVSEQLRGMHALCMRHVGGFDVPVARKYPNPGRKSPTLITRLRGICPLLMAMRVVAVSIGVGLETRTGVGG